MPNNVGFKEPRIKKKSSLYNGAWVSTQALKGLNCDPCYCSTNHRHVHLEVGLKAVGCQLRTSPTLASGKAKGLQTNLRFPEIK